MTELTTKKFPTIEDLLIKGTYEEGFEEILTEGALNFIKEIHIRFNDRRKGLLERRKETQIGIDAGIFPDFLSETKHIREADWQVAPIPTDLQDRRVEITGPVNRKMIINALNSGAKVFMADFEDSNTPNWENNIKGQINLRDAINREIDFTNPTNRKHYALNEQIATLMVRPRGWHLEEKHLIYKGECLSGGLVDFGLFFYHNAKNLIEKGSGPYFYLPKIENHLEARLWNDVFVFAQEKLGIPQKTIKATVLLETVLASFEMDEILYELRDHSAGLNCGRWDYIFSFIKKFRDQEGFIMPNRAQVGMTSHFMSAYSQLVIKTCHKRGVHAMGGMAAQIPIKNNPSANEKALLKVKNDKLLEVKNGHDGTWVAHPALVEIAMNVFDEHMPTSNQIHNKREDVNISAQDILKVPTGTITEDGLRININVAILYIESWLRGNGAAAIYNLMEDAATAEISRTQIWQWIHKGANFEDGHPITFELYKELVPQELEKIKLYVGSEKYQNGRFDDATKLLTQLVENKEFIDFLTLPAYELI